METLYYIYSYISEVTTGACEKWNAQTPTEKLAWAVIGGFFGYYFMLYITGDSPLFPGSNSGTSTYEDVESNDSSSDGLLVTGGSLMTAVGAALHSFVQWLSGEVSDHTSDIVVTTAIAGAAAGAAAGIAGAISGSGQQVAEALPAVTEALSTLTTTTTGALPTAIDVVTTTTTTTTTTTSSLPSATDALTTVTTTASDNANTWSFNSLNPYPKNMDEIDPLIKDFLFKKSLITTATPAPNPAADVVVKQGSVCYDDGLTPPEKRSRVRGK